MANVLMANQSQAIAGLGTWTFTVLTAGVYVCDVESFMEQGSGLSISILQNSSNLKTSIPVSPLQETLFVDAKCYGNPGDTINIVLSSSVALDTIPNNLKSIISVGRI